MKDIKLKPQQRTPRILSRAKRMPRQVARYALLQAKERSKAALQESVTPEQKETPESYAADKVLQKGEQFTSSAGRTAYSLGKKLAQKSIYTIKQRRVEQRAAYDRKVNSASAADNSSHTVKSNSEIISHNKPNPSTGNHSANSPFLFQEAPVQKARSTKTTAPPSDGAALPAGKKATFSVQRPQAGKTPSRSPPKTWKPSPVKTPARTIKTAEQTGKAIKNVGARVRQTRAAASTTVRAGRQLAKSRRKAVTAKRTAQAAVKATAQTGKAVISAVKSSALALKGLMTVLNAGGGVAVVVIIVIAAVGALAGSSLGIFMSGEDTGTGQTIRTAISEINAEYNKKIEEIKANNSHDKVKMSGSRAGWPDVLSVYAVKVSTGGDAATEVASMDDSKKALLRSVFWDMHDISSRTESKTQSETVTGVDENGNPTEWVEETTVTTLFITVTKTSVSEMSAQYSFGEQQIQQLSELQKPEYSKLWQEMLFGTSSGGGSSDMVTVALSQVGNVGGEPYWSWYGFDYRVEWCACFVSWCANECGYIEAGIIPKFAGCTSGGMAWFKEHRQWQERDYIPSPGTIIFFDWASNGLDGDADHVGIVERVEDGRIFTIEGNSNDEVRQNSYPVGYYEIRGYGVVDNS